MTGTLTVPTVGQPNATQDPDIAAAITALNNILTSSNLIDGAQLGTGTVAAATLAATAVTNANVSSSAAIVGSKLNTAGGRLAQTTGLVTATAGSTALGNAYADVAGATATFTPDVACYALVTAVFSLQASVTSTASQIADCKGVLTVDGTPQGRPAVCSLQASITGTNSASVTATVAQVYRVALTVASHTLKLQVKYESDTTGGAAPFVVGDQTNLLYQLVAQ